MCFSALLSQTNDAPSKSNSMIKEQFAFTLLSILILLNSCGQDLNTETNNPKKDSAEVQTEEELPYDEPHQYGGWYCPDNFGFEPVDVSDLSTVPVVQDRMPTQEETRNGTSLMYLPPEKFPDAKPLDIQLPALARVPIPYGDFNELAIIIQAFVAGKDTIVGYRFPNGGNGSAWYGQVDFLTEDEANALEAAPFYYEEIEVSATKAEIWKAFTKTDLAKELGKKSKRKEMYNSEWSDEFNLNIEYEIDGETAIGYVSSLWGNLYMHIDYFKNGRHASTKMLVMQDPISYKSKIVFVTGPFPEDLDKQNEYWKDWLHQLKENSEG